MHVFYPKITKNRLRNLSVMSSVLSSLSSRLSEAHGEISCYLINSFLPWCMYMPRAVGLGANLFYIKSPDCGVCNVMLDKVARLEDQFPSLTSFYTDITEEPLIAGQFLVYSGPTVLLLMDGKEVYRGSQFIRIAPAKQIGLTGAILLGQGEI